jgi:dephospho-CoA kinase
MVVIGVTGGVGTGKSTVAKMFQDLGAVVLDADAMAHQLMEPKRLCWRRVVERFGEDILNEDQSINRRRLAEIVFRDARRRRDLEAIIHPQVLRQIKQRLHRLGRSRQPGVARGGQARRVRAVVLDVPLLVEVDAQGMADALVVVTAPRDVQIQRLSHRYGDPEEAHVRIAAQMELSAKAALADVVVDNAGTLDATRTQVKRIWEQLVPSHKHRSKSSRRRKSTSPR